MLIIFAVVIVVGVIHGCFPGSVVEFALNASFYSVGVYCLLDAGYSVSFVCFAVGCLSLGMVIGVITKHFADRRKTKP